jgi:MYXO-CTERM domain-containing protein
VKFSLSLLIAVFALLACTLAWADLTATQTFSDPSVYPGYTNTGYPFTFSIAPFDPSLGTLNEVIVTYAAQWQGAFSFYNAYGDGLDLQGSQQLTFTLTQNSIPLVNLSSTSGEYDFGPTPIEQETSTDNWSGSTSGTADVTAGLSAWQGGTISVVDNFFGTASLDNPDIGTEAPGIASEEAGLQFGVQYQYTPEEGGSVPEPSTLALGLMALGLGAGRLRRKRTPK